MKSMCLSYVKSIFQKLFGKRKYNLSPFNYDLEYVDANYFKLTADETNNYIVAHILCEQSAFQYYTWVHLKQKDYDLFLKDNDSFNEWINNIRLTGRRTESDQIVKYDPDKKQNYLLSKPESIVGIDFSVFKKIKLQQT